MCVCQCVCPTCVSFRSADQAVYPRVSDVWLHYVQMELTTPSGDPAQASVLHSRATVNLPKGVLRDSFVQRYGAVVSSG